MNICGIYAITHRDSKRLYIGSSKNIRDRWWGHKDALRKGKHGNPYLQLTWTKYGEVSFDFSVLEVVADHSKLAEREQFWLDQTQSYTREAGFNICTIAYRRTGITPWNKGKSWSLAVKAKISSAKIGKPMAEETKARISKATKGKPHTAIHNSNMKEAMRVHSKKIQLICTNCHKVFDRIPSLPSRTAPLCTNICYKSARKSGLTHPNRGGTNQFTKRPLTSAQ
jgi:group I intron endonuclease